MDNILAPNQLDDISTRIRHAKEFLQENPDELPITATRIYDLPPSTLYSSLERPENCKRGGQNKILQQHHIEALHLFIRSLLAYGITSWFSTQSVILNALRILTLKLQAWHGFQGGGSRISYTRSNQNH
jgi:hypothetical protein